MAKRAYIGRESKYSDRPGLDFVEDANLPAWSAGSADQFWSAVDQHSRSNARLFTELEFSLPIELSRDQQISLSRRFADRIATRDGVGVIPYRLALHNNPGNPHVHLMMSSRVDDKKHRPSIKDWFNQVASKRSTKTVGGAPSWSKETDKDWLERTRALWAEMANEALAQAGNQARIDHRSFERRGIDVPPTQHVGWAPGARRDRVLRENAIARQIRGMIASVRREIRSVKAEISSMLGTAVKAAHAAFTRATAYPTPNPDQIAADRPQKPPGRKRSPR